MSLHVESTEEADRRLVRQRVVCFFVGVGVSVGTVGGVGVVLDGMRPEAEPEYSPMFFMREDEPSGGCGVICRSPYGGAVRKPTAPVQSVRTLGLAPSQVDRLRPFEVEIFDVEILRVEFVDSWESGWGGEIECGGK